MEYNWTESKTVKQRTKNKKNVWNEIFVYFSVLSKLEYLRYSPCVCGTSRQSEGKYSITVIDKYASAACMQTVLPTSPEIEHMPFYCRTTPAQILTFLIWKFEHFSFFFILFLEKFSIHLQKSATILFPITFPAGNIVHIPHRAWTLINPLVGGIQRIHQRKKNIYKKC